ASEAARQAEVFRQSEQLKSALLDAVTHDMRTPLTSIKASATTLLAEMQAEGDSDDPVKLDPEGRAELLEVINEETDRLNRFVENMVELARLEAGELQLRRRWGSVEEIVALASDRASELTAKHPIEVAIETELPSARVDATLLAEVLYSLIDNAAKYSPAGSPIKITARRDENEMILLAVEDEGRGVPEELRARVFDKFFRVSNDGANQPNGLGMGLAIARGIVEAHGGRIWIESGENNHGTRMKLLIPIGDEEPAGGSDENAE
ncbi:MAG: ATP-binding protein, partial [Acidobacteriota bacterium]